MKTGDGEVVAEHLRAPRGCAAGPSAARAAAAASSAPRTSVRCSTAATTRSFLVGKWCSCAPRLTPARSETSVVDVPAKPRSTRQLDGRLQQPRAHRAACAPPAGTRTCVGHPRHRAPSTNKQSSLTFSEPRCHKMWHLGGPCAGWGGGHRRTLEPWPGPSSWARGVSGLATAYFLRAAARPRRADAPSSRRPAPVGGKVRTRRSPGLPVDTGPGRLPRPRAGPAALVAALGLADSVVAPLGGRVLRLVARPAAPAAAGHGLRAARAARAAAALGTALAGGHGSAPGSTSCCPGPGSAADPSVASWCARGSGRASSTAWSSPLLGGVHAGRPTCSARAAPCPRSRAWPRSGRSMYLTLRRRDGPRPRHRPGRRPRRWSPSTGAWAAWSTRCAGRSGPTWSSRRDGTSRRRHADGAAAPSVDRHGEFDARRRSCWPPRRTSPPTCSTDRAADAAAAAARDPLRRCRQRHPGLSAREEVPDLPRRHRLPGAAGRGAADRRLQLADARSGRTWPATRWCWSAAMVGRSGDQPLAGHVRRRADRRGARGPVLACSASRRRRSTSLVQRWPGAMPQYTVGHQAGWSAWTGPGAGSPGCSSRAPPTAASGWPAASPRPRPPPPAATHRGRSATPMTMPARGHPAPQPVDFAQRPMLVFWEATRACQLACRHCRASATPDAAARPADRRRGPGADRPGGRLRAAAPDPGPHRRRLPAAARTSSSWSRTRRRCGIPVALSPSVTPLLTPEAIARMVGRGREGRVDQPGRRQGRHARGRPRRSRATSTQTIPAIRALVAAGLTVQINTTVMRATSRSSPTSPRSSPTPGRTIWEVFFLVHVGRGEATGAITPEEHEDVVPLPLRRLALRLHRAHGRGAVLPPGRRPAPRAGGRAARRTASYLGPARAGSSDAARAGPAAGSTRAHASATRDGKGILFVAHDGEVYPAGFLPLPPGHRARRPARRALPRPPAAAGDPGDGVRGPLRSCEYADLCGGSRARAFATPATRWPRTPACAHQPH